MSRPDNLKNSNLDDRLADFTDEALEGRMQKTASNPDEDLILLEEMILRLSKAYPPVSLDEARIKQMQVRFKNRLTRKPQEPETSLLKKWIFQPQIGMLAGALAVLLLFVFVAPFFSDASSSTAATALTPVGGAFLVLGLLVVAAFLIWINRRK